MSTSRRLRIVVAKKNVLLIRLDKIGDLICSLPADQVLDENLFDITWVVQKGLGPVIELGEKKRNYFELDKNNPEESKLILRKLLLEKKFDYAISFQCPWWVNFELFLAKIPIRAGVKSQWHSFFFLNRAIRQKRSLAEKHELEYNLEIVFKTFNLPQNFNDIYFQIPKPTQKNILLAFNLEEKNYVVVHPGMMGSALNWPQSEYINYINQLLRQNKIVVITGTDADAPYLTEIQIQFKNHPQVRWLQSKLKLTELVQILYFADYVVAPSTGVAHIAASVGAHIKGIYSPIKVHHPKRWGPRGPHVEIWMIKI